MKDLDFDKLWDYNDPARTEKKFKEIEKEIKATGDNALYAELLTQIARTHGLRMEFEKAHKILDKAMKMLKPDSSRARIRYLLERGRTYNSSKEIDKARELFLSAFEQAEKYKEDFHSVDAAHMMGIVEKGDESLKWNEIAMKLAEASEDKRAKGWLGALYNNTGWTYNDMGKHEKALEILKKNVNWHIERKSKQGLSIAKWSVGRTLRFLDRANEALNIQRELVDYNKENGIAEDGYNFAEIGECLLVLGKKDDSKPYFRKAYDLLKNDQYMITHENHRLDELKKLSE
ncbi:MAG: hypothetical protein K8I03_03940 [Ignavibacteria bacterium]|nr:hypothetical protein [Ignavibacteria bacterium]